MRKLLISLVGNTGVGKSTLGELLHLTLSDFALLRIDDYRKKFNKAGTKEGETLAQKAFLKDVEKNHRVILESSGIGMNYQSYIHSFIKSANANEKNVLTIKLVCVEQERQWRLTNRNLAGYNYPPMPKEYEKLFSQETALNSRFKFIDVDADIVIDTNRFTTKQQFQLSMAAIEMFGIKSEWRTSNERGRPKKAA
ncbi:MAG: hypothetical protein M3Q58_00255 [Bacteroidota bacterium]|nr:hypothetical protein [Bacteroidota bacterium]